MSQSSASMGQMESESNSAAATDGTAMPHALAPVEDKAGEGAGAHKKTVRDAWRDLRKSVSDFFLTARYHSIRALPAAFVNNSSNILGAAHVGTEVMMFKASLKGGELVRSAKNPIDYVVQAVKRVYGESFKGAMTGDLNLKEMVKGNPVRNIARYITDTEAATQREVNLQSGVSRDLVKLGNPWQTRSTLSGLIVWTLSALIPDKKESPEEVSRMAILHDTNLPAYIAERFRQAIWVPEWGSHKRQMIGLGVMASGIFSTIGAWRNHVKVPGLGAQYKFNPGYFATSIITFVSSLPLLFASDDQKGFGGFGTLMTGRLAFLPSSIGRKLSSKEAGAGWYATAMLGFQAENWTQALVGGAEKLPDGTVVDHEEIKQKAHEQAKELKRISTKKHTAHAHHEVPLNAVAEVSFVEHAMPERVAEAAVAAEKKEAVVA